jgi:2-polyprenyl-3-methyl-5-hydroxy-6-metoxy-1,4-benzoquinol methylase
MSTKYDSKYVNRIINGTLIGVTDDLNVYKDYCVSSFDRVYNDFTFIKKICNKEMKVLDIGATPPLLICMLKDAGYDNLTILDPFSDKFHIFCENNNIAKYQLALTDKPLELDLKYDFINMSEVFEHVNYNKIMMIGQVKSLLTQNGLLHLTTPNLRSFWGLYSLIVKNGGLASKPAGSVYEQYDRQSSAYGYYGHLREYTSKEIIQFFEQCGFEKKLTQGIFCDMSTNRTNNKFINKFISTLELAFPNWRVFHRYFFQIK